MSETPTRNLTDYLKPVADLYTNSLEEHGTQSKGVGWTTEESHLIRFEQLTKVIDTKYRPISINDLGCGYGSLLEYLEEQGIAVSKFNGYDISESMLQTAIERQSGKPADFYSGPLLHTTADYSFASGIFNVRFKETEEAWQHYILEVLNNLNSYSEKGFAFNLLTSYVDWKEDHLFYANPNFFFDYCKTHFSKHVSLLHDYPLWEWTIIVKKSD